MKKVIAILLSLVLAFSMVACGGSGSTKTNTCKSCDRVYEAGDSGGNYKSISKSGMCKRCLDNYLTMSEALGK